MAGKNISVDRCFEDAEETGVLNLCGRNLKEFPDISEDRELIDVIECGECFFSLFFNSKHTIIRRMVLSMVFFDRYIQKSIQRASSGSLRVCNARKTELPSQ